MATISDSARMMTRRALLGAAGLNIGAMALSKLLAEENRSSAPISHTGPVLAAGTHTARGRAKSVIYLCQSGGPSQMDLFDYKPNLQSLYDQELPESVRQGQRVTTMTSGQARFPVAPSCYRFRPQGECGTFVSELLPHTAQVVDHLCIVRSLHTEAINHDPATTFLVTGSERAGRPSLGAWLSYGLGSVNHNIPAFVVMTSHSLSGQQPLYARLWGSGFLPTQHQGVRFRGTGDPVLYLSNPAGIGHTLRGKMLDDLNRLNGLRLQAYQDPEIATRMTQYELAFRMQTSVPELIDMADEPEHVLTMYGADVHKKGSYAFNCLLARRLIERGVRFVQLFHRGWDQHKDLPRELPVLCQATDQPTAALVQDLYRRGLLDETLIVWAGEFGRTIYCQGTLTRQTYGRDHHPRCFTAWLAGGGIRPGISYGETDDFSYNIVRDPVHVHDLNATLLSCLGIDHEQLTYKFQGRRHRLTDIGGKVVEAILS